MAKKNLTAKTLAALKPTEGRVDYFDTNPPGFCVRITPNGVKTFSVLYRHAGRKRRYTIGTYPPLTLADARDKAKAALRSAEKGEDPAAAKRPGSRGYVRRTGRAVHGKARQAQEEELARRRPAR